MIRDTSFLRKLRGITERRLNRFDQSEVEQFGNIVLAATFEYKILAGLTSRWISPKSWLHAMHCRSGEQ